MTNRLGIGSVVISVVISMAGCSTLPSSSSKACQSDLRTHCADNAICLADLTQPDFLKTAQALTEQKNSL